MDNNDKKIIAALEVDGRMSFALLGEKVGVSKTPCWNRVKNLQDNGVICGYSALIDPTAIGLNIRALVHVVVDFGQYQAFEKGINQHCAIRSCHAVTGEFDYVLEILARDVDHFDQLLRGELSRLPGVMRFNTSISTRMVKQNGRYSDML
ncbi:MAG: Lrp/AsnC ligand binding domain-containing protein [Aliiglaciecola sp.]|uniref:Lrp/AsnC family transcriptional regulator n=1 Tax=Aliiglaciecola sp. M165 TaxID=2593649 RepID=UPI00163D5C69|nr:Lrp/AsnC family transcriptional regulator [Aliiglaciecola sp. M165]